MNRKNNEKEHKGNEKVRENLSFYVVVMTVVEKTTTLHTNTNTDVYLMTWARNDKINLCGLRLYVSSNTAFWGTVFQSYPENCLS